MLNGIAQQTGHNMQASSLFPHRIRHQKTLNSKPTSISHFKHHTSQKVGIKFYKDSLPERLCGIEEIICLATLSW